MNTYERIEHDVEVLAGQRTCLPIPCPPRFTLTRLIIIQTGGVPVAFIVTLYSSLRACQEPLSSSGLAVEGITIADPRNYQVGPPLPSDSPGVLVHLFDGGGLPYCNMDTTSPSNKERKLYLDFDVPTGSGPCTFDITLSGGLPV